jgi:transcriptional regulator with XRE-family HTH domain
MVKMSVIKKLRKEKGLSQFELAQLANIRVDQVRRWEQGITLLHTTTAGQVFQVAKALDTTVEALLESEHRPPKHSR